MTDQDELSGFKRLIDGHFAEHALSLTERMRVGARPLSAWLLFLDTMLTGVADGLILGARVLAAKPLLRWS